MKFSIANFIPIICFTSLVTSEIITPTQEFEIQDLSERDFSLPSFVSELLDGFDVADIISNIDFDRIAGWADDLLTSGDNIKILDNILIGLKDTHILPEAAVYIVTHNFTLNVLKESLPTVLSVSGNINTTSLFVALDRSGLAYSVVAGVLQDDELLPSLLSIAKKLIKSGDIDLQSLLDQAGELISRQDFDEDLLNTNPIDLEQLQKRDNVEDLLTTVFGSIERSGLVTDTVHELLTDNEFQDATVVLIQGALQNIGSIISGTNFTALSPFLHSLWESNLLQHTLERALDDNDILDALTTDLAGLLRNGTIKQTDLVSKEDAQSILSQSGDNSMSMTETPVEETGSADSASTTEEISSSLTSDSSMTSSEDSGAYSLSGTGIISVVFAVLASTGISLI